MDKVFQKSTWDEVKSQIVSGKNYTHTDNAEDPNFMVRTVFVEVDDKITLVDKHRIIDSGHIHYATSECKEFDENYLDGSGISLSKVNSEGVQKVDITARMADAKTIISNNYADCCSWHHTSTQVISGALTQKTSGDLTVFEFPHDSIIDKEHGRITFEDKLGSTMNVQLHEDGNAINSGYAINYMSGEVAFTSDKSGDITANYFYKEDSNFIVSPGFGKLLKIMNVELQFSADVDFGTTDSEINFDTYVYNPYDLPNKILYSRTTYKNFKDFFNEANNTHSKVVPAIGELTKDVVIFAWQYPASKVLRSSQGTEIRINISDNKPIGSKNGGSTELSTVTFYCIEEGE
jgi:hypothetical protein